MDLEITGRGIPVTSKLRQQAEEALARIEKILGPKTMAKVVLACEKNRCGAEVVVRNTISDFASECEAKEIEVALQLAMDKVEDQAIRAKKKLVNTRHHPDMDATGSVRLQTSDTSLRDQIDPESKRLAQSKTTVGKVIAALDDGALHDEQEVAEATPAGVGCHAVAVLA